LFSEEKMVGVARIELATPAMSTHVLTSKTAENLVFSAAGYENR
jgi:hypothetical protein